VDNQPVAQVLQDIYHRLFGHYGSQHWWPAEEPFEVMVGAILTQSAAWRNVEKAITNLKQAGALSSRELRRLSLPEIATLIRPCGYYNAKAHKLKSLARWLGDYYQDSLSKLFALGVGELRRQLLSVHGTGQETADSIILYAAKKPVFVIDAYTRRIFSRVGLTPNDHSYTAYQSLFMDSLPADAALFNEYHAQLVCLGKNVCRNQPRCHQCCLRPICRFGAGD